MRGAHQCPHALGICVDEHVNDGVGSLEPHLLLARLLLRHVIDAEELIVAEEQPVHDSVAHLLPVSNDRIRLRPLPGTGGCAAPASRIRTVGPDLLSATMRSISRPVCAAEATVSTPSVRPVRTPSTKCWSCAVHASPRK